MTSLVRFLRGREGRDVRVERNVIRINVGWCSSVVCRMGWVSSVWVLIEVEMKVEVEIEVEYRYPTSHELDISIRRKSSLASDSLVQQQEISQYAYQDLITKV